MYDLSLARELHVLYELEARDGITYDSPSPPVSTHGERVYSSHPATNSHRASNPTAEAARSRRSDLAAQPGLYAGEGFIVDIQAISPMSTMQNMGMSYTVRSKVGMIRKTQPTIRVGAWLLECYQPHCDTRQRSTNEENDLGL